METLAAGGKGAGYHGAELPATDAGLARISQPHYLHSYDHWECVLDQGFVEIAVLTFVAVFVLFRLYTTLGRRTGAERPEPRPQPAQGPLPQEERPAPPTAAQASGPGGEGIMAIVRADPQFEVDHFLIGARGAYELIVNAYAKGDRETLRPLLTPRVYESYASAITAREQKGEAGPELVRLRQAEIADASLEASIARVVVKFEAELAEGAHGVRDAREKWTFERDVRAQDPNWLLARVTAA
jgi:predicted lipid-binding transport protein (Tim44 family)